MTYPSDEKWRDIPGYEGIYQASTHGNIRTIEGKKTFTKKHGIRRWKSRVLIWASEIEEFPIAVTKKRIGE